MVLTVRPVNQIPISINLLSLANIVQEVEIIIRRLRNANAPKISHFGIVSNVLDAICLNILIFLILLAKVVLLLNFMIPT